MILDEVVNRFTGIPWVWKPDWEPSSAGRTPMAGEIKLMMDSADLTQPKAAIEPLTKSARFCHVSILEAQGSRRRQHQSRARGCARDLFAEMPPEAEDGLVAATRERLAALQSDLRATPHRRRHASPRQGRHRQCDRRRRQTGSG